MPLWRPGWPPGQRRSHIPSGGPASAVTAVVPSLCRLRRLVLWTLRQRARKRGRRQLRYGDTSFMLLGPRGRPVHWVCSGDCSRSVPGESGGASRRAPSIRFDAGTARWRLPGRPGALGTHSHRPQSFNQIAGHAPALLAHRTAAAAGPRARGGLTPATRCRIGLATDCTPNSRSHGLTH